MVIFFILPAFIATIFLSKELLKKFQFHDRFTLSSAGDFIEETSWYYEGTGKRGMVTIVFRSKKPFAALIGFDLAIFPIKFRAVDYFGFVESRFDEKNGGYYAVASTYIGRKPVNFIFLIRRKDPQTGVSICFYCKRHPHEIYPPHFWQRLE
ncbi:MAG: hypothetical protein PHG23_02185 [Candidatus Pacebacteria bacterium]|nr:hypothetical protein [Candidatus Paceibacterota bacterium]